MREIDGEKSLLSILNIASAFAITLFLIILAVESAVLLLSVPMVSDNIVNPQISTESDIIMDMGESEDFNFNFTISPHINGTAYRVENHVIFVPEKPMKEGLYHLKYLNKSITFRAVSPKSIDWKLIKGFRNHLVIAFNMDMNRSSVESHISVKPSLNYSVSWYGNTMVISPETPASYIAYHFAIKGNISSQSGENAEMSLSTEYVKDMGVPITAIDSTSYPDLPVTYTFIIFPPGIPALLNTLSGYGFLYYYLFIVGTIIFSLAYLIFIDRKEISRSTMELYVRNRLRVPARSAFFDISMVFLSVISFTVIFYFFVDLFTKPTVPDIGKMSLWMQLYELARAGVWEELITRIPFIGIPLLFIHLYQGKRLLPPYKYITGGDIPIDRATLLLITLCGFMFGFVHMLGGWDAYKIIPAMVAGMGMGYLYARWGIWASITLHFSIDYLSMPSKFFGSEAFDLLTGFFIIFGTIIGVYFLFLYSYGFYRKFTASPSAKREGEFENIPYPLSHVEESKQYIPSTIPYAPYPYRCYSCGNTEAEYIGNGLLKCTRCGSISKILPSMEKEDYWDWGP